MKKKQVKSSGTREVIADVAVRLFGEHGYTGTTMRDIAEAVGVLPGSLYAHIDSKETLLLDIVKEGIARFLAIEQSLQGSTESPELRLRKAIRAHVDVVAEDPQRSLVVFHQWRFLSEPNRASAVAMRRRYANAYVKIVEDGKAAGVFSPRLDTHIAVFGVLGALNWIPEWYSDKGSSSPEEIADRMAESLIFGLREGPTWAKVGKDEQPLPAGRTTATRKRAAVSRGRV
jgi:TetR/AcrR family transcriptional regulator, cholesterol catabolism regulator